MHVRDLTEFQHKTIRTETFMKKLNVTQEDAMIKKTTWIGMVSLLILLSLFLLVTIFSTSKLTSQVKLIAEHPFTVNGDISDVKTNLALMRLRAERLQSYNPVSYTHLAPAWVLANFTSSNSADTASAVLKSSSMASSNF